jgi:hypothetical protein
MKKIIKISLYLFVVFLFVGLSFFFFVGYYSSYIGYSGYDKQKYRRFSHTLEESKQRKVFIRELNYQVDSVKIDNVFIEQAYTWGKWSSKETVILERTDTFNKKSNYSYQIIIAFDKIQNSDMIFIPETDPDRRILLKEVDIKDTLYYDVIIRDSLQRIKSQKTLKVWE